MIIYFENGKRKKEELKLNQDTITLGRAPDNTILITEEGVSRHHAKITKENNIFKLHDLGSSNNTKLNGLTLHNSSQVLNHKDAIRIGSQILEFRLEEREKKNTPSKTDSTSDKHKDENEPNDSNVFSRLGNDAPVIRPTTKTDNTPIIKSPDPLPAQEEKEKKEKKRGKSKEELMKEMEEDLRKKAAWDEMHRKKKKKLQIISFIIAVILNVIIFVIYQIYQIYYK